MIKLPIGSMATPRRIGINGFSNTTAAGNIAKKNLPYRNALINGKTYGRSATTRSGTGTMLNDPPPPPYRPDIADDTTAEPRRLRSLYVAIGLTSTPRVVVVAFVVIPTANPAAVSSFFIRTARVIVVVVILVARILPHPARPSFRRTIVVVVVVVIFVVVAIIIILVARVCFSRTQAIKSTSTTYPSSPRQTSEDFKPSSQKKTHKHVKRHPNGMTDDVDRGNEK